MVSCGWLEVTEGIYQVRGLDLSNMTMVEGAAGVIVIDPLAARGTEGVQFDGDPKTFAAIAALTDQPDPAFPIVTP